LAEVRWVKVFFNFRAKAFLSRSRCYLLANIDGDLTEVRWPELAAYLVNKYSQSISIDEWGFGYIADLPENAVLALLYTTWRRSPPSKDELDEIVAKGTTRLHILRQELGAYDEGMQVKDLFLKDAAGKNLSLCFEGFPKLVLYGNNGGCDMCIEFGVENVTPDFLRRILNDELTQDEKEMLAGISLLQRSSQTKYMNLLSSGSLTRDRLAEALCRSANSTKEKQIWAPIVEWLKRNRYDRMASEIMINKTLVGDRRKK